MLRTPFLGIYITLSRNSVLCTHRTSVQAETPLSRHSQQEALWTEALWLLPELRFYALGL